MRIGKSTARAFVSLLYLVMLMFLMLSATFFMGCSSSPSGQDEQPQDLPSEPSNPYIEQINPNAPSVAAKLPWSAGVNFTQWLDATSPSNINFLRYSEQDFLDVKQMGIDVIRVPIRFHDMTGDAPHYLLDAGFLQQLDMVLDWAEKHEIYIILDNHSWSPTEPTDEGIIEY